MKKLFAALIAAIFAAVTFSAIAADEAKPIVDKPAKTAKKHKKAKPESKKEVAAPANAAAPAKQ